MAYLQKSTHFNNWIFSEDELQKVHRLRQLKARKALRIEHQQVLAAKAAAAEGNAAVASTSRGARKPRSFAALVPKSTTAVRDVNDWNDEVFDGSGAELDAAEEQEAQENEQVVPPLEFLTIEQERTMREFYETKVQESCSQLFRTSDKVKCCAVMLYKRFYLSNSVMEFHPKFIVPTAIYVAGKVEEQYISVDTIAEQLNVDHKHVIGHEMILLEGTRFQLIMYHPFRALLGFVDDFRGYAKAKGKELPLDTLQKLHSNSCVIVNDLLLTDLPLTYYPPFLALAALCQVVEELGYSSSTPAEESALTRADVHEYIRRSKFSQGQQLSDVTKQLDAISGVYKAHKAKQLATEQGSTHAEALAKQVKSLYKKLKRFHDEEKSSSKDKKKDEKKRKSDKKDEKKKAKKTKKEKK